MPRDWRYDKQAEALDGQTASHTRFRFSIRVRSISCIQWLLEIHLLCQIPYDLGYDRWEPHALVGRCEQNRRV